MLLMIFWDKSGADEVSCIVTVALLQLLVGPMLEFILGIWKSGKQFGLYFLFQFNIMIQMRKHSCMSKVNIPVLDCSKVLNLINTKLA